MTSEKKEKIFKYLQDQIAQADFRARAYVFDENNNKNPTRNCFVRLRMFLRNFISGQIAIRWLVITGFRGVGKTTLLSQLYFETDAQQVDKLYLSVDQITQLIGVSLNDVLTVYEEIIGTAFERLEKPLILFLDEVQYDKKWAITLKSIYDRTNKVFIFATGSSALSLQNNPDVARRTISEKLFPMSFTEYIKIKVNKFEVAALATDLRTVIFKSDNAEQVYSSLKSLEQKVRKYWLEIERLEIDRYMKYGTLPFAVKLKNEGLVYDQIKKIIDRIISIDIVEQSQFKSDIISKIPEVLYTVAASDMLSVTNLAKDLAISKITLTEILSIVEKTETLIRIYPYGSHMTQVRKPSKYLFASPAFRSMYYNFISNTIGEVSYMGKLLEDTIGLYLTRNLWTSTYSLTYDSSQGGADFIIKFGQDNIILESGYGEKGFLQISNTSKRVRSKYGLVISMAPLKLNKEKNAVTIPLSYFLLI
ncbi:ATP-binding protein [Candidatus Roizmanbacteria bacterium]|nr:ATP-binding protein [Candidatus Roizmanbacteria bacterium]